MEASGMRGQYAALTWCWGPDPDRVFKTTRETLSQRTRRISKEELNPLFQDIVEICHGLHIPFLWIDALCIVQDDVQDWRQESGRMCDVYSNAFLTVSATDARSPDAGLFKKIETAEERIAMPYYGGGHVYLQDNRFVLGNEVENGAVSQRGWCLQERYLSQRILHIAGGWYEWECLSTTQHETRDMAHAYDDREPSIRPHGFEVGPDALPLQKGSPSITRHPYDIWYRVLEAYTTRQMTHEEDRLPGILGLADHFAQLNGLKREQGLFCGLWKSDLIPGLMWGRVLAGDVLEYRTSSEPTASWSWVSTAGQKEWFLEYEPGDIAVTQVSEPAQKAKVFTITLQGPLIALEAPAHSEHRCEGAVEKEEDHEVCLGEDERDWERWDKDKKQHGELFKYFSSYMHLDFSGVPERHKDSAGNYKGGIFLLTFIRPDATGGAGWGMLLTRAPGTNYYERIGYAPIYGAYDMYPGGSWEEFWMTRELSPVCLV